MFIAAKDNQTESDMGWQYYSQEAGVWYSIKCSVYTTTGNSDTNSVEGFLQNFGPNLGISPNSKRYMYVLFSQFFMRNFQLLTKY